MWTQVVRIVLGISFLFYQSKFCNKGYKSLTHNKSLQFANRRILRSSTTIFFHELAASTHSRLSSQRSMQQLRRAAVAGGAGGPAVPAVPE